MFSGGFTRARPGRGGGLPIHTANVAVYNPLIPEPEKFQNTKYLLYRYATRMLLERVSWLVSANLDIKNPNSLEVLEHRPPEELIADMLEKERRVVGIMEEIRGMLADEGP